ncbi:MAG: Lrp/AsnC family transcriptional regulator [Caulobacteraceae bacterium]|nr:Lrp/AsnC family transcriptional regulator [Caulobacteraceae bacterium]
MARRAAGDDLDPADRRILRELQKDGRISIADLAERVGLTATPCWRRVRDMEQRGVIRGYACLVDPAAAGFEVEALVQVTLERHAALAINEFVAELKAIPNVVECLSLTGPYDAQLRVLAPSIAAFEQLLMNRLMKIAGVAHLNSAIVLNRLVDRAELPV